MGYVADRWHKSRPGKDEKECGEHKGKVASANHGKGKRWQARYDGPDGREHTELFRTQTEATIHVQEQEAALRRGTWLEPGAGDVKVRDFAVNVWLPAQAVVSRTTVEYRGVLDRYLIPEWGSRAMSSIRPSDAGTWQALLTSKYELSGTTPNKVARHIRSVFRFAVLDRVIARSPFEGIRAPVSVASTVNPPDIAEVVQLIGHAYRDRWRAMLELTALTGLRSGEVRGLDIRRVDFLRKQAHIERQLVWETKVGHYFADLKTGAGKRTLPLNDRALLLLAAYVKEHPPPTEGRWAGQVFMTDAAEPIHESTLDAALKRICTKAKVAPRHWHELRHHYASVLIAGGENPRVVQKRLGHKDIATTLRIYTHLWAEAEERTRTVLDDAWKKAAEEAATRSSEPGGRPTEASPAKGPLSVVRA